jgi:hypothetical protein
MIDSNELHKNIHARLHHALDELFADYLRHHRTYPTRLTVSELMAWSAGQVTNPTETSEYRDDALDALRYSVGVDFASSPDRSYRTYTRRFVAPVLTFDGECDTCPFCDTEKLVCGHPKNFQPGCRDRRRYKALSNEYYPVAPKWCKMKEEK